MALDSFEIQIAWKIRVNCANDKGTCLALRNLNTANSWKSYEDLNCFVSANEVEKKNYMFLFKVIIIMMMIREIFFSYISGH